MYWKLKNIEVEEVKPNFDLMKDHSGMVSHSSGHYSYQDVYVDPAEDYSINGDHSYEHNADLRWDAPPDIIKPGEVLKLNINVSGSPNSIIKIWLKLSSSGYLTGSFQTNFTENQTEEKVF